MKGIFSFLCVLLAFLWLGVGVLLLVPSSAVGVRDVAVVFWGLIVVGLLASINAKLDGEK